MQGGKRIRILVVDDEQGFTDVLKLSLERDSLHRVHCVNDSGQVLEAALEFEPDIILLDVVMPGLDGGDVANQLEANPYLRDIPVIIVTALLDRRESAGRTVKMDGHRMLAKPFSVSGLCRNIEDELGMAVQI